MLLWMESTASAATQKGMPMPLLTACPMPHAGFGTSGGIVLGTFSRVQSLKSCNILLSYNEVGDSRHKELLRIEDVDQTFLYWIFRDRNIVYVGWLLVMKVPWDDPIRDSGIYFWSSIIISWLNLKNTESGRRIEPSALRTRLQQQAEGRSKRVTREARVWNV